MTNKEIGIKIRDIRKSKRLKQKDISDSFDFSQASLSQWEAGTVKINAEDFIKILNFFDDTSVLSEFFPNFQANQNDINLSREELNLIQMYRKADINLKRAIEFLINSFNETSKYDKISIIPLIGEKLPDMVEVDYFSQAASMGNNNYTENLYPEKINILDSQLIDGTDYIIKVSGDSMEPTYHSGDLLCIKKTQNLDYGDIGVFNIDGDQLVKEFAGKELISHNKNYQPIPTNSESFYIQGKVLGKVK